MPTPHTSPRARARRAARPGLAAAALLGALVLAPARAQAQPAAASAADRPAAAALPNGAAPNGGAPRAAPPDEGAAGRRPVRPGDVVRVRIWREPDMSGDFPVDVAGRVVLPKLGARDATGVAAGEFERRVAAEYIAGLSHESVAVTVLRRVQITGAVRTPGLYPLDPTVTVDEALAVAGGATENGRADRVQLVRAGHRVSVRLGRDTRLADSPIESGDQLRVPERGWMGRNTAVTATLLSVAGSLVVLGVSR